MDRLPFDATITQNYGLVPWVGARNYRVDSYNAICKQFGYGKAISGEKIPSGFDLTTRLTPEKRAALVAQSVIVLETNGKFRAKMRIDGSISW
jgi:hypothetical protein